MFDDDSSKATEHNSLDDYLGNADMSVSNFIIRTIVKPFEKIRLRDWKLQIYYSVSWIVRGLNSERLENMIIGSSSVEMRNAKASAYFNFCVMAFRILNKAICPETILNDSTLNKSIVTDITVTDIDWLKLWISIISQPYIYWYNYPGPAVEQMLRGKVVNLKIRVNRLDIDLLKTLTFHNFTTIKCW